MSEQPVLTCERCGKPIEKDEVVDFVTATVGEKFTLVHKVCPSASYAQENPPT